MLPHDLPDLMGEEALLHPAVHALGRRGINPAYKVDTPHGPRFVKVIHRQESPHVEPAVAKVMSLLRLPHVPVEYAFRNGRHLNHAPWVEGKPLVQLTPEDVKRVRPQHVANTLFGEWLGNVADRHTGNYMVTGEGPLSIDHGYSLGTDLRRQYGKPHERPSDLSSMTFDPYQWYQRPDESSLYEYGRHYGGLRPDQRVSNEHVAAALAHQQHIEKLVEGATAGIHPSARDAIHAAQRARFDALKEHVAAHGKLTVADLFDLSNHVHKSAENYLQKTHPSV